MAKMVFTNMAAAELATSATSLNTALTLKPGQGNYFPAPTGGNWGVLVVQEGAAWEVMHLTARTGDVLTVVRAREGTIALNFNANAVVEQRVTQGVLAGLLQTDDLSSSTYFLPVDGTRAMTGNLQIGKTDPGFYLTGAGSKTLAGQNAGGINRWLLQLGNGGTESGSNAGNDLALYRYNDAGTYLDTALGISRADGTMTLYGNLTVNGHNNPSITLNPRDGGNQWSWIIDRVNGNTGFYNSSAGTFPFTVGVGGQVYASGGGGFGGLVESGGGNGFRANGAYASGPNWVTILARGNPNWGADGDISIQALHVVGQWAGVRIFVKPYVWDFYNDGSLHTQGNINTSGSLTVDGNLGVGGSFSVGNLNVGNNITAGGLVRAQFLDGGIGGGGTLAGVDGSGQIAFRWGNVGGWGLQLYAGGGYQGPIVISPQIRLLDHIGWGGGTAVVFNLTDGGNPVCFVDGWSDERLKESIAPTEVDALALIRQIGVKRFRWSDMGAQLQGIQPAFRDVPLGLSAQNVQAIIPAAVGLMPAGEGGQEYLAINKGELVPFLLRAIQQLEQRLAAGGL